MNPILMETVTLASGDLDLHTRKPDVEIGVFHRSDAERKRKAKARKADRTAKAARKRNRRR